MPAANYFFLKHLRKKRINSSKPVVSVGLFSLKTNVKTTFLEQKFISKIERKL